MIRLPELTRKLIFLLGILCIGGSEPQAQTPANGKKKARPVLRVAGSVTARSLLALPTQHTFRRKNRVDLQLYGGGSEVAIQGVRDGLLDLALTSRPLSGEEKQAGLQEQIFAYDALVFIVHAHNPISNLSSKQLREIFSGRLKSWKKLGGPDHDIRIVLPDTGSGVRSHFFSQLQPDRKRKVRYFEAPSTYGVVAAVQQDSLALGLCSLSQAGFPYLKALSIDSIAARTGLPELVKYPFVLPISVVSKGQPGESAQVFIDWVTGKPTEGLIAKHFTPLSGAAPPLRIAE